MLADFRKLGIILTICWQLIVDSSAQSITLLSNVQISYFRFSSFNGEDLTNFTVYSTFNSRLTNSWLAVGLSNLYQIQGGNFFICRNSPTSQWIRNYVATYNNQLALQDFARPTIGIFNIAVSANTNILKCSFTVNNTRAYFNRVDYTNAYVIAASGLGKFFFHLC